MNLVFSNTVVKWNNGEKEVEYYIEGIENAFEDEEIIYVEAFCNGKPEYYYVDKNGKLLLSYSIETEKLILLGLNEQERCIVIPKLKEAVINKKYRIFIIAGDEDGNVIYEYSMDGSIVRKIVAPPGYYIYRFYNVSVDLLVVCQGTDDKADKYGRNDWKFKYHFSMSKWEKISLAY